MNSLSHLNLPPVTWKLANNVGVVAISLACHLLHMGTQFSSKCEWEMYNPFVAQNHQDHDLTTFDGLFLTFSEEHGEKKRC